MSYEISGTTIKLTRGDTMVAHINVIVNGELYEPQVGDHVSFHLKHNKVKSDRTGYKDDEPLILKEIPIDTMILRLDPEDTKGLPFDTYVYEVEITFSDGFVSTFIKKSKFILDQEVH